MTHFLRHCQRLHRWDLSGGAFRTLKFLQPPPRARVITINMHGLKEIMVQTGAGAARNDWIEYMRASAASYHRAKREAEEQAKEGLKESQESREGEPKHKRPRGRPNGGGKTSSGKLRS